MPSARTASAPEPAQIYERTRTEGRRRLSRPLLELAATGLVGGFEYGTIFANLGIAVGGNLVGGLGLVTFARSAQALALGSSGK